MDLFVINRYVGDDETNTEPVGDDKLNKIFKKIRKRKSEREKHEQNVKKLEDSNQENDNGNKNDSENFSELKKSTKVFDETLKDGAENVEEPLDSDDEPEAKKLKQTESTLKPDGFTILGSNTFKEKTSAKRVLPRWIRKPNVIPADFDTTSNKISNTGLFDDDLKNKLNQKNIAHLFPVQAEFIPYQTEATKHCELIAVQDVCVSAPTGSGKTLTFVIPVVQHLKQKLNSGCQSKKVVRVLAILPTQALATQIYETFVEFTKGTGLTVGFISQSTEQSFSDEQKNLIAHNSVWGIYSLVDILVCTPGRLVSHLKLTEGFDLRYLEYIIVDEADRVLDTVQDDWLYHLDIHLRTNNEYYQPTNIVNILSVRKRRNPEKLLFSATLSQDPEKLEKLSLFQPKLFTCVTEDANSEEAHVVNRFAGKYTTPAGLSEKYVVCNYSMKIQVLCKLLQDLKTNAMDAKSFRVIVFTSLTDTVRKLSVFLGYMLGKNMNVAHFASSTIKSGSRIGILKKFADNEIQVLLCTDSLARGVDIPNVDCIISYDAPTRIKTYIHRVGRTARAGTKGQCITLLSKKQCNFFMDMLKDRSMNRMQALERIQISHEQLEPLERSYKLALRTYWKRMKKITEQKVRSTRKIKRASAKNITRTAHR